MMMMMYTNGFSFIVNAYDSTIIYYDDGDVESTYIKGYGL